MFAVFLLNKLRIHFEENPDTIEFLRPKVDALIDWLSPLIKILCNFLSFIYVNMMNTENNINSNSTDGFTLASQEDQGIL
jgi:hypothetical protein